MKRWVLIFLLIIILSLPAMRTAATPINPFTVKVEGNGPAMFLFPGLSCTADVWQETVAKFKQSYTVHQFTLSGFGATAPYRSAHILKDVKKALIEYIKVHSKNDGVFIGHSMGGFLGMWLASEENILAKLVIVDSVPFLTQLMNPALKIGSPELEQTIQQMENYQNSLDSLGRVQNAQRTLASMIVKQQDIAPILKMAFESDQKTVMQTMSEMMRTDLRSDIAKIKTKTLVLMPWNEADLSFFKQHMPHYSKQFHIGRYKKQYKNGKNIEIKVIEDARHFIQLDNSQAFITAVAHFIGNE